MKERKEETERIEAAKKRLPGGLGDPVVADEELRSVFLGGHEERLAELLADAKPATAEELKAQGESLARNYKPGPRQARPFLPSNEEKALADVLRAAENLYAFAEAFGSEILTDEGKRQVSAAYLVLRANGSSMHPPSWGAACGAVEQWSSGAVEPV